MSRYKNRIIAISFFFVIFLITVLALIILNANNLIVYAETKYEDKIYSNSTLEDDFEDDSVIIVLDKSVSNFSGISKTIEESLYSNGAISIQDLTALPNTYLNKNGKIDDKKATTLAEYYSENEFNQILKITLKFKSKQNVLNYIDNISKLTGVLYAEPNMFMSYGTATTDDSKLNDQWGLVGSNGIQIEDAWDITTGSNAVRVGVIDSGIAAHEDFKENLVNGYDFYNDNAVTTDDVCGHGTHVAGIIGAYGNNGLGISGVAQRVSLVPLQTAYSQADSGWHHTGDLIEAITYARNLWGTDQQISILNYSIGGFGTNTAVLSAMQNYPGLFVCAVGNDGKNVDELEKTNMFDIPNLISVGAVDQNNERGQWTYGSSNYGKSVNIFAPGVHILSTISKKNYQYWSGTSMAAPHVTGVAALLLSKDPTLTAAELKSIILSSADDITISTPDGSQNVKKLNAYTALQSLNYNIILDKQTGQGGDSGITATYGEDMPSAVAPTRTGYTFKGYYSQPNGSGDQYYGPDMKSVRKWDKNGRTILYAYWEKIYYTVTLHYNFGPGSGSDTVSVAYGETMPLPYGRDSAPIHRGYEFVGYFSGENGSGTQYYSMEVHSGSDSRYYERLVPLRRWYNHSNGDLYGYWKPLECDYTYTNVKLNDGYFDESSTVYLKHGTTATITAKTFEGYKFLYFNRGGVQVSSQTVTWDIELKRSEDDGKVYPVDGFFAVYDKDECIAAGSLITLADGRQVTVESLTGNEELLVWNLYTGMYDTAPILFIDSDPSGLYEVIKLYFSDGTQVKVISEHGFWDYNLNEYVYLGVNAYEYIGHWFNKGETKVQLTDVEIMEEYTTPYSPVTYGHLCYFVDGMLSMPGGIDGLFNIFAVDAETMKYDESAMAADIERYGLFTYEEFAELVPVSEEVFNAFNGLYLKVAIGKGLIDTDRLLALAQRYAEFF